MIKKRMIAYILLAAVILCGLGYPGTVSAAATTNKTISFSAGNIKPVTQLAKAAKKKPKKVKKPKMKVEGKAYYKKVLKGVNEIRADNGCAPLTFAGSDTLLSRCKEMAKGGKLLAPKGSNESTSKSHDGGHTMGICSAVHAWGIDNGDYTKLYVASVLYKGDRWTIVRAE